MLRGLTLPAMVALAAGPGSARGDAARPIEHEPIPPDPANDVAFGLRLDGDLPAAIETPSGLVMAPDPREPIPRTSPGTDPPPGLAGRDDGINSVSRFTPDMDTRRPDALPYSDPFVPATAPWKRLVAFDRVDGELSLGVEDARLLALPQREAPRTDGTEDLFYGDLVVDLRANEPVRIPSVGPGARVLHARLGVGAEDFDFSLLHDSADNWFVQARQGGRARLVLELSIPRAVFGGPFGAASGDRRALPEALPLPPSVMRQVEIVAKKIGVPRGTRQETVAALVDYFRGFSESEQPPAPERSVYLALALSRKGVCRHRAYAFMVTASGLGIRTRMVLNEAHAWVEVADGALWKRIDLGGAGTVLGQQEAARGPSYAPPPDPFDWPPGAARGDDLGRTARGPSGTSTSTTAPATRGADGGGASAAPPGAPDGGHDERASATITLDAAESVITRGQAIHLRGVVLAEGAPCARVAVTVAAEDRKTGATVPLGELATDEHGAYSGDVVIPRSVALGDYELVATTPGSERCRGASSR